MGFENKDRLADFEPASQGFSSDFDRLLRLGGLGGLGGLGSRFRLGRRGFHLGGGRLALHNLANRRIFGGGIFHLGDGLDGGDDDRGYGGDGGDGGGIGTDIEGNSGVGSLDFGRHQRPHPRKGGVVDGGRERQVFPLDNAFGDQLASLAADGGGEGHVDSADMDGLGEGRRGAGGFGSGVTVLAVLVHVQ